MQQMEEAGSRIGRAEKKASNGKRNEVGKGSRKGLNKSLEEIKIMENRDGKYTRNWTGFILIFYQKFHLSRLTFTTRCIAYSIPRLSHFLILPIRIFESDQFSKVAIAKSPTLSKNS